MLILRYTAAAPAPVLPVYEQAFTRENVINAIRKSGLFRLRYRLVLDGQDVPVTLRAAMITENKVEKLIVGVHVRTEEG